VHFEREIFPPSRPSAPVRYVLLSRGELLRTVHRLGFGLPVRTMAELAVAPNGLTIARALALAPLRGYGTSYAARRSAGDSAASGRGPS
jgi:hypothetical protein